MQKISTTEKNITPPIVCTAPWRVIKVEPLENFQIVVEFVDGVKGPVLMKERIFSPKAGIFSKLKNESLFKQVFVQYGVTTWPGEIDLAPDAMHDEIQKNGQWVLK
jgi:hypothetical protein